MSDAPVVTRTYPVLRQYMTPSPVTISRAAPLSQARAVMAEHGIRHLPVTDGSRAIGLLSERDVLLLESVPGANPTELRVEEAMSDALYVVSPDEPLGDAVEEMIARKLGSAVAVEDGRVVGVFTTVDALRALADLLKDEV